MEGFEELENNIDYILSGYYFDVLPAFITGYDWIIIY